MSSDDLNLPASLERLEINPERLECSKTDENPFAYGTLCPLRDAPDCSLESLSLNAVCPKGNCLCNRKKDGVGRITSNTSGISTSLKSIVHHRRPILRRSKLNREVLRAPILKLSGTESCAEGSAIGKSCSSFKSKIDVNSTKTRLITEPAISPVLCYPTATSSNNTPSNSSPTLSDVVGRRSLDSTTAVVVVATSPSAVTNSTVLLPSSSSSSSSPQSSSSSSNYLTTAASSSHCCALQARTVNSNNAHLIVTTNHPQHQQSSSSATTADDTNIDELASYFDLLVHIPKKMSVMAEMMYI